MSYGVGRLGLVPTLDMCGVTLSCYAIKQVFSVYYSQLQRPVSQNLQKAWNDLHNSHILENTKDGRVPGGGYPCFKRLWLDIVDNVVYQMEIKILMYLDAISNLSTETFKV